MARPVRDKADFVRRYARGEFGNASPTWDSYEAWHRDRGWRHGSLFHVRCRVAGGRTWYNIHKKNLRDVWEVACRMYWPEELYISAMAPTEKTLIQGEVMRGTTGLVLTYSTVPLPMREALSVEIRHAHGLAALQTLRRNLCPMSMEWMCMLLDEYPDHIIEFSTYGVEWGTVRGYNTVFWEVRLY